MFQNSNKSRKCNNYFMRRVIELLYLYIYIKWIRYRKYVPTSLHTTSDSLLSTFPRNSPRKRSPMMAYINFRNRNFPSIASLRIQLTKKIKFHQLRTITTSRESNSLRCFRLRIQAHPNTIKYLHNWTSYQ